MTANAKLTKHFELSKVLYEAGLVPAHHLVFLYIAIHPGISISEVSDSLGITRVQGSRARRKLSELEGAGKEGLGLVYGEYEKNFKTEALYLTEAGKKLIKSVEKSL